MRGRGQGADRVTALATAGDGDPPPASRPWGRGAGSRRYSLTSRLRSLTTSLRPDGRCRGRQNSRRSPSERVKEEISHPGSQDFRGETLFPVTFLLPIHRKRRPASSVGAGAGGP